MRLVERMAPGRSPEYEGQPYSGREAAREQESSGEGRYPYPMELANLLCRGTGFLLDRRERRRDGLERSPLGLDAEG